MVILVYLVIADHQDTRVYLAILESLVIVVYQATQVYQATPVYRVIVATPV